MTEAPKDSIRQPSFTDLTMGEMLRLVRYYFTATFVSLVVFGLPWALFFVFDFGLRSPIPGDTYAWWSPALFWIIVAFIGYLILRNVPYFFRYFGDMWYRLSDLTSKMPRLWQILSFFFLFVYFWGWFKHPTMTFWFSISAMNPVAFTYDEYVKVLKSKSKDQDDQDIPQ